MLYLVNRPRLFTIEPAILKNIVTDLKSYIKHDGSPNRSFYGQKIIGTESVLSGNGLGWAIKRKVVTRFFAKTKISDLYYACKPHMEGPELQRWKDTIKSGKKIELHYQLGITFTSFLHVLGCENLPDAESIADNVFRILEALPKQHSWSNAWTKYKLEVITMIQNMRSGIKQAISEKAEKVWMDQGHIEEDEKSSVDMVGFFLEANLKNTQGKFRNLNDVITRTVDDLMAVCLVMDNMVKQISSLFMLLNDEPECQRKMFEELRETSIDTFEGLNDLKYTEKCLLECLRMRPVLTRGQRIFK